MVLLEHEWVAKAGGRVTVFLRAAASVPAGFPTSRELIGLVTSAIDLESRAPEASQFIRDRVDMAEMDVEQLFRSIGDLRQVMGSSFTQSLVELPACVDARKLRELQFDILDATVAVLRERSRDANVRYLSPLVEANVRCIATPNFDTLVELAAFDRGASVSTGIDDWDGGLQWPVPRDSTPLLKLHGPLDWHQEIRKAGPIPVGGFTTLARGDDCRFGGGGIVSSLRFGVDNKLTQAGGMPALLEAFTSLLEQSDLVVAVGYSFRDHHIDAVKDRWAALDDARRLLVIDPTRGPHDLAKLEEAGSRWFGHMVAVLRHDSMPGRGERVRVLEEFAETAFGVLFH